MLASGMSCSPWASAINSPKLSFLLICVYLAEPVPQRQIFNPYAVQRPHAKDTMLERQGSFRGFSKLAETSPFKRQLSLRLNELPSTLDRQKQVLQQPGTVPEKNGTGFSPIPEASPSKENVDSIAMLCQEVSQGLSALSGPTPAKPGTQTSAVVHQTQTFQQSELTSLIHLTLLSTY